jgi:uncharacterized membrane protein YjgN (DUF898 family)
MPGGAAGGGTVAQVETTVMENEKNNAELDLELLQMELEQHGAPNSAAPGDPANAERPFAMPRPEPYRFIFTGSAGEYFRIWIVNLFLTVLTAGIYAAWAKVRTRRYFYSHTLLAGYPFDYMANPWFILKGNIAVGAGFLVYLLFDNYYPLLRGPVIALFYMALPFLIHRALRFNAYNSVYRSIRFRFRGTLGESYRTYLLLPVLIPLTLGIILPYWAFRRKKYFFENFSLGAAANTFSAKPGPFFQVYGLAALLLLLWLALTAAGLLAGFSLNDGLALSAGSSHGSVTLFSIIMYALLLVVFAFIQQYIHAKVLNYCWRQTRVEKLRFQSKLAARRLLWIRLTNLAAIFISAGLLIPWAKVRRFRYTLAQLTVISESTLDDYTAAVETADSAIGEAATDFFNVDIGL